MTEPIKYASVCSGIEAATVAWHPLGWLPVWFSQFDPEHDYVKKGLDFASKVLKHHYPHVPNLGDMTKLLTNKIFLDAIFDVLVGGTPCQSFSLAGLRGGLDDQRGNLALEFVRILIAKRPKWFVWENVPGVLSSGGKEETYGNYSTEAEDFACILSAFTGLDIAPKDMGKAGVIQGEFYSVAWRILDSQYFGVPQQRRRIFVVGHLGTDWRPPYAVLFEPESLRGDITPGGKKRKGTAATTENTGGANDRITGTLTGSKDLTTSTFGDIALQTFRQHARGYYTSDDMASPILKRDYKDATDLIVYNIGFNDVNGKRADRPEGGLYVRKATVSNALTTGGNKDLHIIYDITQITSPANGSNPKPGNPCPPLKASGYTPIIVPQPIIKTTAIDCRNHVTKDELSNTLQAKSTGGQSLNYINPILIEETYDQKILSPFYLPPPLVFSFDALTSNSMKSSNPLSGCRVVFNAVKTLDKSVPSPAKNQGGNCVLFSSPIIPLPPLMFLIRQGKEGGGKGYLGAENRTFTLTKANMQQLFHQQKIRRLTPLECERLQGFPEFENCITFTTCLDLLKAPANAENQNPKLQKNVGNVERIERLLDVSFAKRSLSESAQPTKRLAAISVELSLDQQQIAVFNHERLLLFAKIAEKENSFHPHISDALFAHLIATINIVLEKIVRIGKEENQKGNGHSYIAQLSGKVRLKSFGKEITQLANVAAIDAESAISLLKSTTLNHTQDIQNLEATLQTLFCYVTLVIDGFIPDGIPKNNLSVSIKETRGYTNIPGASDTARYEVCGNSMTTNVMHWIGSRIDKVHKIITKL